MRFLKFWHDREARALERFAALLENDTRVTARLEQIDQRLDALPAAIATAVREAALADVVARAALTADRTTQPMSIMQADRLRVQEQRERERET